MRQTQSLRQEMQLSQVIDFANLLSVPDEVLHVVAGVVSYNPDTVEKTLKKAAEETYHQDSATSVQSVFASSLPPSKGDATKRHGGIIVSPNVQSLENMLSSYKTMVTPDVTYIGRMNTEPEIVFSDHLKGTLALLMVQLDVSQYPETTKLLYKLRRFDEWKRKTLRDSYVYLGGAQREYFEDFEITRFNLYDQTKLANDLDISISTASRILSNRWVEARNIAGKQKFIYTKDLCVTADDLKRFHTIPMVNEILKKEYKLGKAHSDQDISNKIPNVARRTIAKYRKIYNIPATPERNEAYRFGKLQEPYRIVDSLV